MKTSRILLSISCLVIGFLIGGYVEYWHSQNASNMYGISTIKPEYVIELVNEDSVKIETANDIYICRPEQIQETIFNDNL